MKQISVFLLTFLLVSIMIGIILYILFRKHEKVIIYEKSRAILLPIRQPIDRPWWDFGGVPMKPTTPSQPPSQPPKPSTS